MANVPLIAIKELLSHKSIQTTLRYSHLSDAHLQASVERLTTSTSTKTDTDELVEENQKTRKRPNYFKMNGAGERT
jgi:hypothetical protein